MTSRKNILTIAWIAGLLFFGYLLYRIGPLQIWENLKNLSWINFFILFFLRTLYWITRTFFWKMIYGCYEEKLDFWDLFQARLAGHAISYLTPSAYFGGEAIRAVMMTTQNRRKSVASIVVDKSIEIISVIMFAVIGLGMAISIFAFPNDYKLYLILSSSVILLLALFVFRKLKQGLLMWIIYHLEKMKIKFRFLERHKEKIEETDEHISDFYITQKKMFRLMFFFYSLLHLFWIVEIHLTLVFIGTEEITFLTSFIIVTLGIVGFLLPVTPAALGTYEITYVALFSLMGLRIDLCLSLTIIRRFIALIWSGVGLLMIALKKAGKN